MPRTMNRRPTAKRPQARMLTKADAEGMLFSGEPHEFGRNVLLIVDNWRDTHNDIDAMYFNLAKKWEKGTFDPHLAKKGFRSYLDRVNTQHKKRFEGDSFSIAERDAAASELVNRFLELHVLETEGNQGLFPTAGKQIGPANFVIGWTARDFNHAMEEAKYVRGARDAFWAKG